MARQLPAVRDGSEDYLVVCTDTDVPVAKGGVNYQTRTGAGFITQVAVRDELRSLGIGTFLVGALEKRIWNRGLRRAELIVEENNPRARALYERLGYVAYGRSLESWDAEDPDGVVRRHESRCTLMRRDLAPPPR